MVDWQAENTAVAVRADRTVQQYTAWDGVPIKITLNDVIDYLVKGNKDLVTRKEVILFLEICKAQQVNPFAGDVFLVKYVKDDPASIITSIEYARTRARLQEDCQGWECGCILMQDNAIIRSNGLVLEGQKLLGGWFRARPKGWLCDYNHEVNLAMYIKKTKEGNVTRFWTPDKQPHMIMKVAEFQGLKALWPKVLKGMHEMDEMPTAVETTTRVAIPPFEPRQQAAPAPSPAPVDDDVPIDFPSVDEVAPETLPPVGSVEFGEMAYEGPEPPSRIDDVHEDIKRVRDMFWAKAPRFVKKELILEYVNKVAEENKTTPDLIMQISVAKWQEFEAGLNDYVKKKQEGQMKAEVQKATAGAVEGPRAAAVERVTINDAMNHLAAFKKHHNPIMVLEEMMKRAGMGHDKLKKDLKKFNKRDEEMLWEYCHNIIAQATAMNVQEVKCPNGDVMLKTYCDNICTKKENCAAFGGK